MHCAVGGVPGQVCDNNVRFELPNQICYSANDLLLVLNYGKVTRLNCDFSSVISNTSYLNL
jgi:hypothetical protein